MWSLVQNGGQQVMSTLVFLILARFYLSKEDFGLVVLVTLLITFLNILVRQGLVTALIQRKDLDDDHVVSAFWTNAVLGLLFTISVFYFASPIAHLMGETSLVPIIQFMSISILLTSLGLTQEALLSREMQFKSLAKRTLLAVVLSGCAGLITASLGWGVWALAVMHVVNSLVGVLVLWGASSWRPHFGYSVGKLLELTGVSVSIFLTALIGYFNQFIDQIIVGGILGPAALGTYYVAGRLIKAIMAVTTNSLVSVTLPAFSKIQDDDEKLRKGLLLGVSITSFVGFPVFGLLMVSAPEVIGLVLGKEWLAVSEIMSWLSAAAIVYSVQNFNGSILIARGHSNTALLMMTVATAILWLSSYIGVGFGLLGVAVAAFIKPLIMFPIWLYVFWRFLGIKPMEYINVVSRPLLITLVAVLFYLVLNKLFARFDWSVLASLLLGVVLSASVYIAMFYAIDRTRIRQMLGLIRRR